MEVFFPSLNVTWLDTDGEPEVTRANKAMVAKDDSIEVAVEDPP